MLSDEMVEALKMYYMACRDVQYAVIDHLRYGEASTEWWDK
jgi:hypothetical protein